VPTSKPRCPIFQCKRAHVRGLVCCAVLSTLLLPPTRLPPRGKSLFRRSVQNPAAAAQRATPVHRVTIFVFNPLHGVRQFLPKGHTPWEGTSSPVYINTVFPAIKTTVICYFSRISLPLCYNTLSALLAREQKNFCWR
jgi:hypothetical protein